MNGLTRSSLLANNFSLFVTSLFSLKISVASACVSVKKKSRICTSASLQLLNFWISTLVMTKYGNESFVKWISKPQRSSSRLPALILVWSNQWYVNTWADSTVSVTHRVSQGVDIVGQTALSSFLRLKKKSVKNYWSGTMLQKLLRSFFLKKNGVWWSWSVAWWNQWTLLFFEGEDEVKLFVLTRNQIFVSWWPFKKWKKRKYWALLWKEVGLKWDD